MRPDSEREIEEIRGFFLEHGLLPPIPERYADDEEEAERVRQRVLARGRTTSQTTSHRRKAARSGSRRRRMMLATVAAVLIVLGGGAQAIVRSAPASAAEAPAMLRYSVASPESIDSAPPAAATLKTAARATFTGPPPVGVGEVQYVAKYGWSPNVRVEADRSLSVAIYPTRTQWWSMRDGAVRVDETRGNPLGLDGHLTADAKDAPSPVTSETNPAGTIDPDLAGRLSTNPAALRAELLDTQAGLPCDQDARWQAECLVRAVQMVYDEYVVTPKLASAMWSVLAGESALRSLGATVDRLGRPARTVALPPEPGQPSEQVIVLLISESTGAYLGTEIVTLHDAALGISKPTVTAFSELSAARWVKASGNTS